MSQKAAEQMAKEQIQEQEEERELAEEFERHEIAMDKRVKGEFKARTKGQESRLQRIAMDDFGRFNDFDEPVGTFYCLFSKGSKQQKTD